MNNFKLRISVTNIDSNVPVKESQLDLIHEVLQHCDPMLRSAAKGTPAYLMGAGTFGRHFDGTFGHIARIHPDPLPGRQTNGSREPPSTEYLGVFTTAAIELDGARSLGKGAKIFLCPERILACANATGLQFDSILVKVFLHEWMHAWLHVSDDCDIDCSERNLLSINHFIEESTANLGTLKAIESAADAHTTRERYWNSILAEALSFVERQPPAYALGAEMFKDRSTRFDPLAWIAAKHTGVHLILTLCEKYKTSQASSSLTYVQLQLMWSKVIDKALRA